jgi:hypothetical protein
VRRILLTLTVVSAIAVPTGQAGESSTQEKCSELRKGINFYKQKTWDAQKSLGITLTPASKTTADTTSCRYLRWVAGKWRKESRGVLQELRSINRNPQRAICHVFGDYCGQALRVSSCETGGTYHVGAQNGQYLGLFQMGNYARSRYGHGTTALEQARAAYGYFRDSGYDWSPWSCKP